MRRQLWQAASPDCELIVHGGSGTSRTMTANGLFALFWPDGRVCWQVNIYLCAMRRRNLAVSTVNTYCVELSQFVRFLGESGQKIESTTDDTLLEFSRWLPMSRTRPASARHRNRIVLQVLRFLEWLQEVIPVPHMLIGGPGEGASITVTASRSRLHGVEVRQLHHPALVPNDVPRVVRPIATDTMQRLMDACWSTARSSFARARNLAILKLLADCGVRRQEAVWLTVSSIRAAVASGRLRVRTAKRRGNPEREVPLPRVTIQALLRYVDVDRALHMAKLRRADTAFLDGGWAFCTLQGRRMASASLTQMVAMLRRHAGISERASAHMFRHRWITLQVVERLRALQRTGPLGAELLTTLLSRIASLSGHARLQSLWVYVDWACEEAGVWHSIDMRADAGSDLRALRRELREKLKFADATGRRIGARELNDLLLSLDGLLGELTEAAVTRPARSVAAHSLR